MQAELGFTFRGTTDAALVLQQSIAVGAAANGMRWLWELKRQLHEITEDNASWDGVRVIFIKLQRCNPGVSV